MLGTPTRQVPGHQFGTLGRHVAAISADVPFIDLEGFSRVFRSRLSNSARSRSRCRKVSALGVHADRIADDNRPLGDVVSKALGEIKHARDALEAVEYKVIEVHERQNE